MSQIKQSCLETDRRIAPHQLPIRFSANFASLSLTMRLPAVALSALSVFSYLFSHSVQEYTAHSNESEQIQPKGRHNTALSDLALLDHATMMFGLSGCDMEKDFTVDCLI